MNMFRSVLENVPKMRSQMVNDLDIPEVPLNDCVWCDEDLEDSISSANEELEVETTGSESSLALSRALTDSEIDYDIYRRLKSRSFSDPWVQMRSALAAFPPGHLDSLNSFKDTPSESTEDIYLANHRYNEELKLKMERFFEEECRVFSPDDPGLILLEDALNNADTFKDSDSDFAS